MIRVLLDQGLAPRAADLLRAEGWDAVHVGEVGLDQADDPTILEYGRQHGFTCITLDHDFHSHLATSSAGSPSVVFLRAEGLNSGEKATLILQRFGRFAVLPLTRARPFRLME